MKLNKLLDINLATQSKMKQLRPYELPLGKYRLKNSQRYPQPMYPSKLKTAA
jgi:hypothetical protein